MALLLAGLFVCSPVLAGYTSNNVEITCTYPGKIVEAGEKVTFDLSIKNNGDSNPKKLYVDTFDGEEGWKYRFLAGETEIDRIALNTGGEASIKLEVDTAGDTKVDSYPLRVRIDDGRLWLYINVKKTHAGESGVLKMSVVNEQGEKIKGAKVTVFNEKTDVPVTIVYSTADGAVRTEVPQGEYVLKIEKDGYLPREKDDISIKSGYTTDSGTLMLERKNYGLDIDVKSPTLTVAVGEKPLYEMKLSNVGKSDDTYTLSSADLPDGWYSRYRETAESKEEISEIFIRAGEEKTVFYEVIPPYSVDTGDYEFKSEIISSSGESYTGDFRASVKGKSELQVFSEKYRYEVTKGGSVDVPVTIYNKGTGVAITNIAVEVSTPEGWQVGVSPKTIPSIMPGEKKTVTLKVVPPSGVAASEYKITLKVKSDQGEKSDDLRIVVNESSIIGILGILLLIGVGGGVYYMFRKYERR